MVSHLDWRTYYSDPYYGEIESRSFLDPIVSTSFSIGYETKLWNRFSLTAAASNFNSGGKVSSSLPYVFNGKRVTFNNTTLGLVANYYIVNKKTQFYFGIGPRIDYLKPDYEMYEVLAYYEDRPLRIFKLGASGNIGFNYQVNEFYLGLKSTYYYRFGNILEHKDYGSEGNIINRRVIKDFAYDLQLVFGYQFGKKKTAE